MIPNLQINPQRLWDSLMETARIGGTAKGGVSRLTLTDTDRQVRDWLKSECERLGCTVTVDEVGNMFAVRPGRRADLLPIAIGSHLDTQPTGEEGSRFAPAMLGSGVYAGVFDRTYADSREDRQGVTFGDAIEAIGYRGAAKAGSVTFGAMFELHIEQGPILEQEEKIIGVVEGVQGMRWYEISVTGREAHTGSTPMPMRHDALVGAARLIDRVEGIALEHAPSAVGSVGLIEVQPNSRNVVPGHVFFTVDFRHPQDDVLDIIERKLLAAIDEMAGRGSLGVESKKVWESPAVRFDTDCLASVKKSAQAAGYPARDMISGAGHDAAYIARVAPTAMIFVPCAGGLSHNEEESTSFEECAAGVQVLLGAVLDYDERGTERLS
ncbi:MAG: Zn-dependent hydrolase [Microvirga sp.]|nr:Zn-dependent hydrolase [Microvirga sp.]